MSSKCYCKGTYTGDKSTHNSTSCFDGRGVVKLDALPLTLSSDMTATEAAVLVELKPHMREGEDAVACVKRLAGFAELNANQYATIQRLRALVDERPWTPPARASRPAVRGLAATSRYYRKDASEEWGDWDD